MINRSIASNGKPWITVQNFAAIGRQNSEISQGKKINASKI